MIKNTEFTQETIELNMQNEPTISGADGCADVAAAGAFLTMSGAGAAHLALEGAALGPEEWGFGMAVTGGLFLAGWGTELGGAIASAVSK